MSTEGIEISINHRPNPLSRHHPELRPRDCDLNKGTFIASKNGLCLHSTIEDSLTLKKNLQPLSRCSDLDCVVVACGGIGRAHHPPPTIGGING
ncbi:hypothetical protein CDL15_Pgr027989 [Punica granatum]|uniref:Uncharacterized protein n=1 Tax=Punica granatum TaxID=22663 RepID=A0A218XLK5_PUNGR|nr:hypothetical protein CDL15_Pgr027989 [Punica granatum]